MRLFCLTLSVLLIGTGAAFAQDPVTVAPNHYTVEFENDHVRVLRVTYKAGDTAPMHRHPGLVAVFLTDGQFKMMLPGGKAAEGEMYTSGRAVWADGEAHAPTNMGKGTVELILVEIKDASAPTAGD